MSQREAEGLGYYLPLNISLLPVAVTFSDILNPREKGELRRAETRACIKESGARRRRTGQGHSSFLAKLPLSELTCENQAIRRNQGAQGEKTDKTKEQIGERE